MITHNGKYLLHATHHGMPIVAATMGGKMVFGSKWLLPLTLQAIVAAFGAEGTEVIAKTNDYLNQIATTDPQRALLLAGFINEDPMLVCSLVETSKTRWLVGDGKAYVDTGLKANSGTYLETKFYGPNNIGARDGEGKNMFMMHTQSNTYFIDLNTTYYNTNITANEIPHILVIDNVKGYLDGVLKVSSTITPMTYTLYLMAFNNYGKASVAKGNVSYVIIDNHHFVPFDGADRIGMLDLNNLQFYPNANTEGSFTITLTDKTTS